MASARGPTQVFGKHVADYEKASSRLLPGPLGLSVRFALSLLQPLPTGVYCGAKMQSEPPGYVTASLVATILTCYRELLRLPNLRPSSTVDGLFGNLVEVCCSTLDEEIMKGVSIADDISIKRHTPDDLT